MVVGRVSSGKCVCFFAMCGSFMIRVLLYYYHVVVAPPMLTINRGLLFVFAVACFTKKRCLCPTRSRGLFFGFSESTILIILY